MLILSKLINFFDTVKFVPLSETIISDNLFHDTKRLIASKRLWCLDYDKLPSALHGLQNK